MMACMVMACMVMARVAVDECVRGTRARLCVCVGLVDEWRFTRRMKIRHVSMRN